jgi:hypothetical protein
MTASDEMVEWVAKAIALDDAQCWEELDAIHAAMFFSFARAAIAAMREPTEAMLAAVVARPDALIAERVAEGDEGYAERMDAAVAVERAALASRWRAMIDAALANPSEIPNSPE